MTAQHQRVAGHQPLGERIVEDHVGRQIEREATEHARRGEQSQDVVVGDLRQRLEADARAECRRRGGHRVRRRKAVLGEQRIVDHEQQLGAMASSGPLERVAQAGRGQERKGFLDEKIFRNYITTRVLPRARVCYNRALARAGDQGGRVVLEMEVGKGEVIRAGVRDTSLVRTGDAPLLDCLTEAAWALDVPAAKMDEKVYIVRYPMRLVAPIEGKHAGRVDVIDKDLLEVLLAQPIVPQPRRKSD